MAETLDSQIAYSLRSEIRKKIFLRKIAPCATANICFEKILRARSTTVQKFCAAAFALIDKRVGSVFRIAELIADVIEYLVHFRRRLTDSISVTVSAVIDLA
jgi:hypothetical protein